jgi:hypothetical protein
VRSNSTKSPSYKTHYQNQTKLNARPPKHNELIKNPTNKQSTKNPKTKPQESSKKPTKQTKLKNLSNQTSKKKNLKPPTMQT